MLGGLSKRNLQYGLIVIFAVVNIFIWSAVVSTDHRGNLTVAFLNVGQGDAIYIEAPNGNQMLIDGGPSSGALMRSLGQVMPYWDRSIDVVLATHADQDHVGGLPAVIESMNVQNVITTENTTNTGAYNSFENAIVQKGATHIIARTGERVVLDDGVVLEVLFPDCNTAGWETNTSSIVARLSYGDKSFLFTGDSPQSVEKYILGIDSKNIHSTILKLGHHGSKTSNSKEFLSAVDPKYAVVSAGKDNKYGHPNKEIIDLASELSIPIISTITRGTIIFKTNGKELTFEQS